MLRVLPNRYIALLLKPREASMLEGQILDPSEFPWQDSEAMVIGMGVKSMLHEAVAEMTARELDASINAIHQIEVVRREALGADKEESTPTPIIPSEADPAPEEQSTTQEEQE